MTPCNARATGGMCRTADLIAIIPAIRALARCLCIDPARGDALARDCVLAAWDRRKTLNTNADPTLWAFAIVCELFRDANRPTETQPTSVSKFGVLGEALAQLPPDRREVLALVIAARLTQRSAAEVSGATRGEIKSRLTRARLDLDEILTGAAPAPQLALAAA